MEFTKGDRVRARRDYHGSTDSRAVVVAGGSLGTYAETYSNDVFAVVVWDEHRGRPSRVGYGDYAEYGVRSSNVTPEEAPYATYIRREYLELAETADQYSGWDDTEGV